MLPWTLVGSCPTFSPLPRLPVAVIFFSVPMPSRTSPLSGARHPLLPGLSSAENRQRWNGLLCRKCSGRTAIGNTNCPFFFHQKLLNRSFYLWETSICVSKLPWSHHSHIPEMKHLESNTSHRSISFFYESLASTPHFQHREWKPHALHRFR